MKIIEFIASVILGVFLFPFGIAFEIFQILRLRLRFVKWFWIFTKRIVLELYDIFEVIAVKIDILGNIILGRLFESIFVQKEFWKQTLFGKDGITISASFGHSYEWIYLNEYGVRFVYALDKVFGKKHCDSAYWWHLIKTAFKSNNKTAIS